MYIYIYMYITSGDWMGIRLLELPVLDVEEVLLPEAGVASSSSLLSLQVPEPLVE